MSIRISEQDAAKIQEQVESGHYPDVEAAVHEAIGLLLERDREREWLLGELQIGIDQADRGELIDLTPEFVQGVLDRVSAGKLSSEAS